ncbi:unnamed protein product [Acanthoscelides obtectus]|nr:unnamed protein product [Acanthoscelides obtectus]CAK1637469.1 tRNA (adenine(37)-N6)-methyltransferase [Acanthoscelides obtectus]
MIALNHVYKKEHDIINKKLEEWQCRNCRISQDLPASTSRQEHADFKANYIGVITTSFPEKRGTPRQPGICADMIAKLTLSKDAFTNPAHTLEGLQEFSHMWILFHFHKNESTHVKAKVAPPRLNGTRTGVFATRSPHRPCPIGLSLVKIDRILDDTIYFSGVDMIDNTPVLDIKPYIPQYDNPGIVNLNIPNVDLNESVTEIADAARDLSLASTSVDDGFENGRIMDGEENVRREQVLGSSVTERSASRLEENYARSHSRMGEREAPDGEEEEPPEAAQALPVNSGAPQGHVRVPSWIDNPPASRLTVLFKDRALMQLGQLGSEGEEKKTTITNILQEDPRSVYLRERWSSHCYIFRIAELYVSCKFNDSTQTVMVYQVFQNEVPPDTDD